MKKIKSSEYISVAEVSDELSIPVDRFRLDLVFML